MDPTSASATHQTSPLRRGGAAPIVIVVAAILVVAAGLGIRALLRSSDGVRRAPATTPQFYWPITQPTGPGMGTVSTMLPEQGVVAVGEVRLEEWKLNNEVRFADAQGRILAHGAVRAFVNGTVHVKYEPEPGAPRDLATGDRAIRTGKTLPDPQEDKSAK